MKSVFDTHGRDSGLNDRSGQMVEVLRLLTGEEADLHETGPMYRVRFDDGTETDAFLEELPSIMEVRICEAVYDITTVVCGILHKNQDTAEFVDLDSRDVFSHVYDWACEFENEHPCPEDYMTEIEEFAYEKFREYLAHFNLEVE